MAEKVNTSPPNGKRRRMLWGFTIVLLVLALLWVAFWFFYLRFHETTDDANANGNLVNINSAISAPVIAFYADDTNLVVEGQVLVELDPTEYCVKYEKELATLTSVVLQVRQLYDTVKANLAAVESKKVALEKARYDYENRKKLIECEGVSQEDFVHAKDTYLMAQHDLEQTIHTLHVSYDARGRTTPQEHPLILQQKAAVRDAYYNLFHCTIYAPTTGFVAQRTVDVGQFASPSTNLMAVIPMDYLWVDANFKETQLSKMRIGQKASVTFDLYGSDVVYEGTVLGIASGTGSVFSLIPPQNATGNWIKIVQRLPVRISLDPETVQKYPPRLGISAYVNVNITDQDLPRLAEVPHQEVIAKTKVFDIDFSKVDALMDELVHSHLGEDS